MSQDGLEPRWLVLSFYLLQPSTTQVASNGHGRGAVFVQALACPCFAVVASSRAAEDVSASWSVVCCVVVVDDVAAAVVVNYC